MNLAKLKGKIAECGFDTLEKLENATKIKSATLSRKLRGESEFKLGELNSLRSALCLTDQETNDIFFDQNLH